MSCNSKKLFLPGGSYWGFLFYTEKCKNTLFGLNGLFAHLIPAMHKNNRGGIQQIKFNEYIVLTLALKIVIAMCIHEQY